MDAAEPQSLDQLVDLLFREHYRGLVTRLIATMGSAFLEMAEDAVSEAMLKALKQWPFHGIPEQPRSWLFTVARNVLLDKLKRGGTREKHRDAVAALTRSWHGSGTLDMAQQEDEELAMMLMACHSDLNEQARVCLTLKVVGGFSVREIARAFLAKEATIAQRLVRTRRFIQEHNIRFEMPVPSLVKMRLPSLLDVLYLMFTEGHMAHEGDILVRRDICAESLRLGLLLAENPSTSTPEGDALCALFLFVSARFPGRADAQGGMLLLREQDRSSWDREMIARGVYWLGRSARGERVSAYHLEAEIAMHHTTASSFDETDWAAILGLYDQLMRIKPTPIIALNRIVVLAHLRGAELALEPLQQLAEDRSLQGYYPLYMTLANFYERLERKADARKAYQELLGHCHSKPVLDLVQKALTRLA